MTDSHEMGPTAQPSGEKTLIFHNYSESCSEVFQVFLLLSALLQSQVHPSYETFHKTIYKNYIQTF